MVVTEPDGTTDLFQLCLRSCDSLRPFHEAVLIEVFVLLSVMTAIDDFICFDAGIVGTWEAISREDINLDVHGVIII